MTCFWINQSTYFLDLLGFYSCNLSCNKFADNKKITNRLIIYHNQYVSANGNSTGYPKQVFGNYVETLEKVSLILDYMDFNLREILLEME